MADFFVDSSATGNNSGTSATDAAIDINSLTIGGTVNFGDRVWVRRTMAWQANSFICGRSGWDARCNNPIEIIGWPSSGDPHYFERPNVPSWDADATPYGAGFPWPAIVTSGTGAQANPNLRNGFYLTNFVFTGSTAKATYNNMGVNWWGTKSAGRHWGKIGFLNMQPKGGSIGGQIDEVIFCSSGAGSSTGMQDINASRFVITASCLGTMLFTNNFWCQELVNQSNSVDTFILFASANDVINGAYIGRVSGIQPKDQPFATQLNADFGVPVLIDDWFGQGPRQHNPMIGGTTASLPTSGTAVISGTNATRIFCNSVAPTSAVNGGIQSGKVQGPFPHVAQPISVKSGVSLTVTMFFFHAGVGSLDGNRNGWMQLTGLGGGRQKISGQTASGGLYAGNAGDWAGSSVAVGSAYIARHKWTPTDTGTAMLLGHIPVPIMAWNAQCVNLYVAPFFDITTS